MWWLLQYPNKWPYSKNTDGTLIWYLGQLVDGDHDDGGDDDDDGDDGGDLDDGGDGGDQSNLQRAYLGRPWRQVRVTMTA